MISLKAHTAINHIDKHSVQYSNIDYFSNLILSIPKCIQLVEPNSIKSLEREPWVNILKAASQMIQNFTKVSGSIRSPTPRNWPIHLSLTLISLMNHVWFESIPDPPPSYEEVVEGRKPPFQSQLTFCTSETSNETLVRPSFQSHSFGRSFSSTIANERNFRKVIFS